ncbi:MAG: rhomboid family intramembrane serine protease [Desulfobacterales bacterium]
MIPIRDTTPSAHYPIVNTTLIAFNVMIFLVQMAQGPDLGKFIYFYGLVPARYSIPQISDYFSMGQQAFSLLSFMFLHGGFLHLLGNMWTLYIFGDNIEDRLGHLRYLVFYLLCGIGSGLAHLFLNAQSNIPTIGASGAVAGVMGAYLILYPTSRILTLIPIIFIPWFVEIPAFFFLGLWFFLQFLNAASTQGMGSGIAWWAHIGGFLLGIVLLRMFSKIPMSRFQKAMYQATAKKKTHRLQVVRPGGGGDDNNLYGTISVSRHEASAGARKLINVPWGLHNRMFNINVPPGTREGSVLRLRGLGRIGPDGGRGDLMLTVKVT